MWDILDANSCSPPCSATEKCWGPSEFTSPVFCLPASINPRHGFSNYLSMSEQTLAILFSTVFMGGIGFAVIVFIFQKLCRRYCRSPFRRPKSTGSGMGSRTLRRLGGAFSAQPAVPLRPVAMNSAPAPLMVPAQSVHHRPAPPYPCATSRPQAIPPSSVRDGPIVSLGSDFV